MRIVKFNLKLSSFLLFLMLLAIFLILTYELRSWLELDGISRRNLGDVGIFLLQFLIAYVLTSYLSKKITTVEIIDNNRFRITSYFRLYPFYKLFSEFYLTDLDSWKVFYYSRYGEFLRLYLKNGRKVAFTKGDSLWKDDQYDEFKKHLLKLIDTYNEANQYIIKDRVLEFYKGSKSRSVLFLSWSIYILLISLLVVIRVLFGPSEVLGIIVMPCILIIVPIAWYSQKLSGAISVPQVKWH